MKTSEAAPRYSSIRAEYVNPFLTSAAHVFRTMLNCELRRGTPYLKRDADTDLEISGIIGLSGEAVGAVVLSMARSVALEATAAMLGEMPPDLDEDVVDAVGELTNMIAGNAKAKLEELRVSISLPSVIIGLNHSVSFPSGATPIGIPLTSDWGNLCVEVGLCRQEG
mgnify:CR=1 FL=1